MFVFALTIQDGLHEDALHSGVAITPMAVGYFAGSLLVPRLIPRFGRLVITTGMVAQAVGLVALVAVVAGQWPHVSTWAMAPGLLIAGIGQSFGVGGLFRLVLADIPHRLAGVGSGVLVTVQQGSNALGVASLGTLFVALSDSSMRHAFIIVIGIQVLLAVLIAVGSLRLPNPSS
jgi:MFS family permease